MNAAADLTYCALVLFFAYTVRGVAGFGSALISVPLLTFRLPLEMVVPFICLVDFGASMTQAMKSRRYIQWSEVCLLAPGALLAVISGIFFFKILENRLLGISLGIFVAGYGVYNLLPLPKPQSGQAMAPAAGFMGGMVSVLLGTGGPLYVIYMQARGYEKGVFRATIAFVFMLDGLFRITVYGGNGFYTGQTLFYAFLSLIIMICGIFTGERLQLSLDRHTFVLLVNLLLAASGFALLVKFI